MEGKISTGIKDYRMVIRRSHPRRHPDSVPIPATGEATLPAYSPLMYEPPSLNATGASSGRFGEEEHGHTLPPRPVR